MSDPSNAENSKYYPCVSCTDHFSTFSELLRHRRKHFINTTPQREREEPEWEKENGTPGEERMFRGQEKDVGEVTENDDTEEEVKIACGIGVCASVFKRKKYMRRHQKKFHPESYTPEVKRRKTSKDEATVVNSDTQNREEEPSSQESEREEVTKTDQRVLLCGMEGCDREYHTHSGMRKHQRRHHPKEKARQAEERRENEARRKREKLEGEKEDIDEGREKSGGESEQEDRGESETEEEGGMETEGTVKKRPTGYACPHENCGSVFTRSFSLSMHRCSVHGDEATDAVKRRVLKEKNKKGVENLKKRVEITGEKEKGERMGKKGNFGNNEEEKEAETEEELGGKKRKVDNGDKENGGGKGKEEKEKETGNTKEKTGTKRWCMTPCPVSGCPKVLKYRTNMARHIRSHDEMGKETVCAVPRCGFSTERSITLVNHRWLEHGDESAKWKVMWYGEDRAVKGNEFVSDREEGSSGNENEKGETKGYGGEWGKGKKRNDSGVEEESVNMDKSLVSMKKRKVERELGETDEEDDEKEETTESESENGKGKKRKGKHGEEETVKSKKAKEGEDSDSCEEGTEGHGEARENAGGPGFDHVRCVKCSYTGPFGKVKVHMRAKHQRVNVFVCDRPGCTFATGWSNAVLRKHQRSKGCPLKR